MSYIEELINKYCPNGVQFRELKSIAEIKRGERITKKNITDEGYYPVISGGLLPMGKYNNFNREKNTITISSYGAAGFVNFIEEKFWANDVCLSIHPKEYIINRFLFFYLKKVQNFLYSKTNGGIPNHIPTEIIKSLKIPLPPIEIQKEIVRILDSFTNYSTLLNKELELRKKQYEYYSNKLLFNNKFKRFKMSDICTVNQGLQIPISQRKKEDGANRYFYITVQFLKDINQDIYYIENPHESVICREEDILITRTGSTGKVITGVRGCFHNNFFKLNLFENINSKYIYYLLSSNIMYNKMLSSASNGTVPDLTHKIFYNIEIPIPPLEEQERIVNILDKFDTLCNSITNGLPREIELRKKQYEYYRDKLLNFNI